MHKNVFSYYVFIHSGVFIRALLNWSAYLPFPLLFRFPSPGRQFPPEGLWAFCCLFLPLSFSRFNNFLSNSQVSAQVWLLRAVWPAYTLRQVPPHPTVILDPLAGFTSFLALDAAGNCLNYLHDYLICSPSTPTVTSASGEQTFCGFDSLLYITPGTVCGV